MPYKSEKIKISGGKYDRRVKLNPEQKKEIYANELGLSQRKLALNYGVSRRTIQFILDPEKLKENLKRREERGGSKQYYNKEDWAKTMKEHRGYKQDLKLKGKIN
jgi:DNA-binding XRE family transcriptional regulator